MWNRSVVTNNQILWLSSQWIIEKRPECKIYSKQSTTSGRTKWLTPNRLYSNTARCTRRLFSGYIKLAPRFLLLPFSVDYNNCLSIVCECLINENICPIIFFNKWKKNFEIQSNLILWNANWFEIFCLKQIILFKRLIDHKFLLNWIIFPDGNYSVCNRRKPPRFGYMQDLNRIRSF